MASPSHKSNRLPVVLLLLLPLLWYAETVFTDASYFGADLLAQYHPWWTYAHDALRSGHFPLWNPYVLGGMPFHTNPDNSLFYPLNLPLFPLSFFKAAAILRVLNTMVASLGMYVLLRGLGTSRLPAFVGASGFSYGSFMSYQFVHLTYVNTAVWFPWQLLFLRHLVRAADLRASLWLALVTAAAFFGGSMSIFMIGQVALGGFLLCMAVEKLAAREWIPLGKAALMLAAAALLASALTLVLLAPAARFIRFSPRVEPSLYHAQMTDFSVSGSALKALLFPYYHVRYGAPYPSAFTIGFVFVPYVGTGGALLALMNLLSRRHARLLAPAAIVFCFGLLMAMGTRTGFFPWMFGRVVPFQWFRWPHDYLFMSYAVLSILAATGLDVLWRDPSRHWRGALALCVAYGIAGFLWEPHRVSGAVLGAALVGAGAAWFCLRRAPRPAPGWRPAAAIVLSGAVLLDLFAFGFNYRLHLPRRLLDMDRIGDVLAGLANASRPGRVYAAAFAPTYCRDSQNVIFEYIPLVRDLPPAAATRINADHWVRRVDAPDILDAIWDRRNRSTYNNFRNDVVYYPVNASMLYRYEEMSGYDPFMIDRIRTLFLGVPLGRLWNLMNVTHVVTPNRIIQDRLAHVAATNGVHVYENRTACPRVMLPRRVRDGLGPEEILAELAADGFDPRETVLFDDVLPQGLREAVAPLPEPAAETASVVDSRPERVVVDVALSRPGVLVLHDAYYPGWTAQIEGRELEIRRANYAFRAVFLPAGRHRVDFRYRPAIFRWSAGVSAAAWVGCIAGAAFPALRTRTRRRTA